MVCRLCLSLFILNWRVLSSSVCVIFAFGVVSLHVAFFFCPRYSVRCVLNTSLCSVLLFLLFFFSSSVFCSSLSSFRYVRCCVSTTIIPLLPLLFLILSLLLTVWCVYRCGNTVVEHCGNIHLFLSCLPCRLCSGPGLFVFGGNLFALGTSLLRFSSLLIFSIPLKLSGH